IDQDISRFDAKADDPSQVPYHGVWLGLGLLLQSFLTSRLDLFDLADDEAQARHIALQLGRDIRRQRRALRRVQCCNTLRSLAQGWFEIANAQPGEGPLHSVDDARAFPDQAVTSLRNQCTSIEVGHFSFRGFSHVFGMSVPPNEHAMSLIATWFSEGQAGEQLAPNSPSLK